MGYKFERPTQSAILTYLTLAERHHPATRVLKDEDIVFGIAHGFGWADASAFAAMIVDLGNTPFTAPPLWLREGEVFLRTLGRLPARHCQWGRSSGKMCRKPVVQVRLTWGLERCGGPDDPNYVYNQSYWIDGWRHLDGTPLHSHRDYGDEYFEFRSCDPIPLCLGCGQEYTDSHCGECHVNGALHTTAEAYGNRVRCTTPGCVRKESFYDIGD